MIFTYNISLCLITFQQQCNYVIRMIFMRMEIQLTYTHCCIQSVTPLSEILDLSANNFWFMSELYFYSSKPFREE